MTTGQSIVQLLLEDPTARAAVMNSNGVPDVIKYELQDMIDKQS